jgi:hypothetical protein
MQGNYCIRACASSSRLAISALEPARRYLLRPLGVCAYSHIYRRIHWSCRVMHVGLLETFSAMSPAIRPALASIIRALT